MRPEPFNYNEYFADEDDVSSTAAVNEADDTFFEEKKRSATEDENPGATKKSKADGEGEHISAALPRPQLPNLILSMKDDTNYRQIMNEAILKIIGKEFSTEAEKEMGASILQKLQQDYHLLDTNGEPAEDGVALHKIRQCLRNKYNYDMSKADQHQHQSQSSRSLPNMILDMAKDKKYRKIMTKAFEKIYGEDFDGTIEESCEEVLQELKQRYHLLDRSGKSIDDSAALGKLVWCIKNQHTRSSRTKKYQQRNITAPPPVPARTTTTRESHFAGDDIILDMRVSKFYKDTMNKFFNEYVNKEYDDIVETGGAMLHELQRSLGTEGKFLKRAGNGLVEVKSEAALEMILQRLEKKSQNQPFRNSALPRCQSTRSQDHSGRVQSQNQEVLPRVQTLTRDKLSEAERVELLEYFGHSIVADYLKKNNSCGWKFQLKSGPIDDEWVAMKEGFTKRNAQEDVTMLTGVRKIANWAFREGHFESYANDEFGRTMLERKGLSVETYKIIFDRESGERTGATRRRTDNPNSSSRVNIDGSSNVTLLLRGEELSEYTKVYKDIAMKRTGSDINADEFYGLLQKCLETKMLNTQQWNAKKYALAHFLRRFEDAVEDAAAISQRTGSAWFRDGIIPAIIDEAKGELLGA